MKLIARKRPLDGSKHYGTQILISAFNDEATRHYPITIEVWHCEGPASTEELALLHEGEEFEYCDSHYQSQVEADICDAIVEAINREP